MNNKKIRIAMINNDLKQYQLAQIMKTHEGSISRLLKDELPEEEQDRIVRLIEKEAGKNDERN